MERADKNVGHHTTEPMGSLRRFRDLLIDPGRRRVLVGDRDVSLTKLEFGLLMALTENPGAVWTPRELLEQVWGYTWLGDDHVVETNIGRLRAKLGESARSPRYVYTVRGVGYRFEAVLDQPHLHHIVYDASLTIMAIEPADLGVLGRPHSDLIGRCVVFHSPNQSLDQESALSIVQSMAGMRSQEGPRAIGAFDTDGAQHIISLVMCFTRSLDGQFQRLVAHLLVDDGQAAKEGVWPDGGHGSLCHAG